MPLPGPSGMTFGSKFAARDERLRCPLCPYCYNGEARLDTVQRKIICMHCGKELSLITTAGEKLGPLFSDD